MRLPIVSQHLLRLQCLDMLHLALPHSLCTPTPDFVHLLRHDCQNHAPSTLLAMSTARHQMSLIFFHLYCGLIFCLHLVHNTMYPLSLISKALWSHVLVLILLNIIGLSSNTRSSLICTMLDFILCLLPDLNKNGQRPTTLYSCLHVLLPVISAVYHH